MSTPMTDLSLPFQIDAANVRGRFVRLGPALKEMLDGHDYPDAVAAMMGETAALAATLASSLKYDGLFTLQTQSDGAIPLLVADLTSDGDMRGYARINKVKLAQVDDDASVPHMLGAGHLAFTVDQGPDTERYQGITALEGATLSECAQAYFRQSEQLETAIVLMTSGIGSDDPRAGALMVQRMPGSEQDSEEHEDAWRRAVVMLSSLKEDELLSGVLSPEEVLFRLYHEDGVRVYEPHALRHKCRCSRDKMAAALRSFPRDQVTDSSGQADVTCDFCKAHYHFTAQDIDNLFS